jgi:hypothetical protein
MPAFNFNSAPLGDLGIGTYYAIVVSALPLVSAATIANLSIPPAFPPFILQSQTLTVSKWTFADFTFANFAYPSNLYGVVVARRIGSSPATTDPLINFSPFVNTLGQEFLMPAGSYAIPVTFGALGAMQITPVYRYSSGVYVAGGDGGYPRGLIYLMGTKNNTLAFNNPVTRGMLTTMDYQGNPADYLTDRLGSIGTVSDYSRGIDFLSNRVRVGNFAFRGDTNGNYVTYALMGSNNLPSQSLSSIAVNSSTGWTALGSITAGSNSYGGVATSLDPVTFWRYLRITATVYAGENHLAEVEFYNSTIESPIINIG